MSRKEKKEQTKAKKKGGRKALIIVLVIVILIAGGVMAVKYLKDNNIIANSNDDNTTNDIVVTVPKINIFNGDSRPIAVAFENSTKNDWPQPGLENAYLVYELPVEGGMTKLLALYKGVNVDKLGYIRSARPCFIDYALENDAVLVHYGHSDQTVTDEASLKMDYIDGIILSGSDKTFWTVSGYTTGNAKRMVASTSSIEAKMKAMNIRATSTDTGLGYIAGDYDLEDVLDSAGNITNTANSVSVKFSTAHSVSFTYDAGTKLYARFQRGAPHVTTNNVQLTTKNIIVQFVQTSLLSGPLGHVQVNTVGTGTGYFITNGKSEAITWSKDSRSDKTKYIDKDGNEIKFNDGVTYIEICPTSGNVTIE